MLRSADGYIILDHFWKNMVFNIALWIRVFAMYITVQNDVDDEVFKLEETLTQESSVSVFGKIRKNQDQ